MRRTVITGVLCAFMISLLSAPALPKVGGGDIIYSPRGAGKVSFQHQYHVNIQGMRCSNCHYKAFQMSGTDAYRMDMALLTKGQFCGICHDGKQAFDVKDAALCVRCHKN